MTELYNFPDNEDVRTALFWMGENYAEFIAEDFTDQFRAQDPDTEMLALTNEAEPEFEYTVSEKDGLLHGVKARFRLEFLLKAGDGQKWRISGLCVYDARNLHVENKTIDMSFDVDKTEAA
jgi:hypothetical protein